MPVSRATAAIRSMVGPGMGSAQSKYSRRVSTQKYMVLKSSDRQTMRAPCRAASRTIRMAVCTLASRSTFPTNWTPAIFTGGSSRTVSAECGHDPGGPVSHEAMLVVEVHAHPELAGARIDGALELLHAVSGRAHDGEAVGEVVDEPQVVDDAAVPALRHRVVGERIALAQRLDLRQQLGRDVLALGGEARQMVARHGERHLDLLHPLAVPGRDVDVGPPPEVERVGIAPGLEGARPHLRDGVADDLGQQSRADDGAVGDRAGQPQRLRS